MDDKAKDLLKMGLLDSQSHREEMFRYMGMIQRFDEAVSSNPHPDGLCRDLVRIVLEETEFEKCSIFLWDGDRSSLDLAATMNLEEVLCRSHGVRSSSLQDWDGCHDIFRQVYVSRTPVFLESFMPPTAGEVPGKTAGPLSLASMPIGDLGVLNLSTRQPSRFPFQVRRNWEILCKIIGFLVKNSSMERGVSLKKSSGNGTGNGEDRASSVQTRAASRAGIEGFMEQALDFTPQGICLLDSSGLVAGINRSMRELHGEGASEMIGRSPAIFFLKPEVFKTLLQGAVPEGRAEMADVSLVNQKGETYLADVYLTSLPVENGRSYGYLLVINDVTKKKAFAEKILQTEKLVALGTMAGGVAHDFNNLLMAILGHIQLLVPRVEDEDIVRRLQNIEKAVFDGSHIIRRLQKFTERDRELGLTLVPVDVAEAIHDVVELTRPRWKNAMEKLGHTIRFELDLGGGCMARIHGSDLREVLTNLVFNAIDAMPQGGVITMRCKALEKNVSIEVADTGIGMTSQVSSKIFDPFYTTKGIGNSGLGLSVCWSLITRHGGEIQVKSAPGKGATFYITLPIAECRKKPGSEPEEQRGTASHKILVVDDDEEILSILRDMMRLKGHRVHAAGEGAKALELIERNDYDLVLSDLGMPVISGWEIAKRVKEKDPGTPVVLITGWGAQYEEEDLSSRGVDAVLSKPLSWEKLLGVISRLLASDS